MSNCNLDSDKISDYYFLSSLTLKVPVYIDNRESLDDLLAFIELFGVVIESHSPSLVGGEATILLERDIVVPLSKVLDSFVINIGELDEVIMILPHALHKILREGYDRVSCYS